MPKAGTHFDFDEIEEYLTNKTYPSTIPAREYGSTSNFQRATKSYEVKDGHLFYKKRLVIKDKERQMEIIRDVHQGIEDSEHSKATASNRGKTLRMTRLHKDFFGIIYLLISMNMLRFANSAKNKVT